jgi:hypothetical protein
MTNATTTENQNKVAYTKGGADSPLRVFMSRNGVKLDLVQVKLDQDFVWVGTPYTQAAKAPSGLVFSSDGRVIGGPAVAFFATSGRSVALKDSEYRMARAQLTQGFREHLNVIYTEEQREADRASLGQELHNRLYPTFIVDDGVMTAEQQQALRETDLPQDVVDICSSHGFTIKPNLKFLLRIDETSAERLRRRLPSYVSLFDGAWDDYSEVAVLSAGFSAFETQVFKELGLRIAPLEVAPRRTGTEG